MAADPLFPSELAVIVTAPSAAAVTIPVGETVATALLLEDQVIERPVNVAPPASVAVAPSCMLAPGGIVTAAGATVTVATGGLGPPGSPHEMSRLAQASRMRVADERRCTRKERPPSIMSNLHIPRDAVRVGLANVESPSSGPTS
jgi:hypothetical protein